MKKMKVINLNERFFKYTGNTQVDYLEPGDIIRLRQMTLLDRPNLFAWKIDYFHAKNIGKQNVFFSHLCSTDYVKAETPDADWELALKWAKDLYHNLEQIDIKRPGTLGGLSIFGKKDDFDQIENEFEELINEFRKKHPEALISNKFNWDWIG